MFNVCSSNAGVFVTPSVASPRVVPVHIDVKLSDGSTMTISPNQYFEYIANPSIQNLLPKALSEQ